MTFLHRASCCDAVAHATPEYSLCPTSAASLGVLVSNVLSARDDVAYTVTKRAEPVPLHADRLISERLQAPARTAQLVADTGFATPGGVVVLAVADLTLLFDRTDLAHLVGFEVPSPPSATAVHLLRALGLKGDLSRDPEVHLDVDRKDGELPSRVMAVLQSLGHLAIVGRLRATNPHPVWAVELIKGVGLLNEALSHASPDLPPVSPAMLSFPVSPDDDATLDDGALERLASSWDPTDIPNIEPTDPVGALAATPEDVPRWIERLLARDGGIDIATTVVEAWSILATECTRRAIHSPSRTDAERWWLAAATWWRIATEGWHAVAETGDEWADACWFVSEKRQRAAQAVVDGRGCGISTDPGPRFTFEP